MELLTDWLTLGLHEQGAARIALLDLPLELTHVSEIWDAAASARAAKERKHREQRELFERLMRGG